MGMTCSTNGAKLNACRLFVGTPEGNRSLGRLRCRWSNNMKIDLGYDGVVWTGLIWLKIGTNGGRR
jgi:hypothetical protein